MHGIKKFEKTADYLAKYVDTAQKYLQLSKLLINDYRQNQFPVKNLDVLNKALMLSPLDYTLWNYRYLILKTNFSPELAAAEQKFCAKALQMNAKIYAVWEYRRLICLILKENNALQAENERGFIFYMLKQDGRNFHAWNHLRSVSKIATGYPAFNDDYELTQTLVEGDFSNYSAYHHRALVIQMRPELRQKEINFIYDCLQISPNDESLWTAYHVLAYYEDVYFVEELVSQLDESDHKAAVYYARLIAKFGMKDKFYAASDRLKKIHGVLYMYFAKGHYLSNQCKREYYVRRWQSYSE